MINTLKTLCLRALSSLSTLGFTFLSTYLYGLKEVGSFALFLSLSSFVFFIIKFGMEMPLFVILTKNDNENKIKTINEFKYLQNIIFLSFAFFLFLVNIFFNLDNAFLMCLSGIIMTKTIMNSFSIRAKGYTNLFVFLQLGNANLFAIFFLFISKLFSFSNPIIISFFLGNVMLFLISFIALKLVYSNDNSSLIVHSKIGNKNIFRNSFTYFCLDIINNIFTWTPLFVIFFLFSEVEQGIYLNIAKLGSVFIILLFILETIVMKNLAELSNKKLFSQISSMINLPKKQMIFLSILIFSLFIILGDKILFFIDKELIKYKFDLILYSLSQMTVLFFGPLALFMKVSGNQVAMRNIVAISSLVNIILAFILGYYIGLSGIFISAIFGNLIWCIIVLKFINNKYEINF